MTTQIEFARALFADISAAFADVGMCSVGTYTPKGGAPISDVRMYVDHEPLVTTPDGAVRLLDNAVRVTLLRDDVMAAPRREDVIVAEGATYRVSSLESRDEAAWVVLCQA